MHDAWWKSNNIYENINTLKSFSHYFFLTFYYSKITKNHFSAFRQKGIVSHRYYECNILV